MGRIMKASSTRAPRLMRSATFVRMCRGAARELLEMEKFTVLEGVPAPLRTINVDTDAIIPKQYLKTIKRTGLGKGLFSEQRYKDDGSENPDFVLNKPAYHTAKVLVGGDNFGL